MGQVANKENLSYLEPLLTEAEKSLPAHKDVLVLNNHSYRSLQSSIGIYANTFQTLRFQTCGVYYIARDNCQKVATSDSEIKIVLIIPLKDHKSFDTERLNNIPHCLTLFMTDTNKIQVLYNKGNYYTSPRR